MNQVISSIFINTQFIQEFLIEMKIKLNNWKIFCIRLAIGHRVQVWTRIACNKRNEFKILSVSTKNIVLTFGL